MQDVGALSQQTGPQLRTHLLGISGSRRALGQGLEIEPRAANDDWHLTLLFYKLPAARSFPATSHRSNRPFPLHMAVEPMCNAVHSSSSGRAVTTLNVS